MNEEATSIIFDGKKFVITKDLIPVVNFLQMIDEEVESMLGFEKKLENIRSYYLETMGLMEVISKKIIENNLDFKFEFSKDPNNIGHELVHYNISRAEMIVLFANFETILCLYTAYEYETENESEIRNKVMDKKHSKKFINNYILNKSNKYYLEHHDRFKRINAQQIRDLRNKLTHFFAVGGLNIIPHVLNEKARILEKKSGNSISFISPTDFYELVKNASLLLITNWSDENIENPEKFFRKIQCVVKIVKRDAPILISDSDVNV